VLPDRVAEGGVLDDLQFDLVRGGERAGGEQNGRDGRQTATGVHEQAP
jgi:hypothetical protein